MTEDIRPERYRYYEELKNHIGGESRFFNGDLVYPRQLEIHLPGDKRKPCVMHCTHCQGMLFEKGLGDWESIGLSLLHKLKGAVPYHIYGGAYTEPVMNPYFGAYLGTTKYYGNLFGIHTSGAPLWELEEHQGLLTEMLRLQNDERDYISFSLDAGSIESHMKGKGLREDKFTDILKSIEILATAKRKMAVRLCYLLNKWNSSEEEIEFIVTFARRVGVDSLRFSVPYAKYNQSFDRVREYKEHKEVPVSEVYRNRISPYTSKSHDDIPYIFYVTPEEGWTDIDLYDFNQCVYGYFQITLAADGYMYKCSAVAAPDAPHLRLGKITDDIDKFEDMVRRNQCSRFNAQSSCFAHGVRCNRMAVECNRKYRDGKTDEGRTDWLRSLGEEDPGVSERSP